MTGLLIFLAGVGLTAILGLLILGVWVSVAGDRQDVLDEAPTLDVQNHIGDTRPLR